MHKPSEIDTLEVEEVWPPPPVGLTEPCSQPPYRAFWGGILRDVSLTITGLVIGFVLIILQFPPLTKVSFKWSAIVVVLFFSLVLLLGISAWKEQKPFLRGFLWLACGVTSAWALFQTLIQISFT